VVAFTKALAAELSDRQIRVNAVVSRPAPQASLPLYETFENVVRATQFLCAAHGAFVSGQTIDLGVGRQGY
jgi:NAD(P)-dependent dehydrogenase (short-subunit alcohol dehydrogenase family)